MQLSEHTFNTWDGTELAYRAWTPPRPNGRFAILFHRGHEHSARWDAFARSSEMAGYTIFAWDQRGHGHSPGERGSAPDLAAVIRDADRFARHLIARLCLVNSIHPQCVTLVLRSRKRSRVSQARIPECSSESLARDCDSFLHRRSSALGRKLAPFARSRAGCSGWKTRQMDESRRAAAAHRNR